jgi:hypothetical protein
MTSGCENEAITLEIDENRLRRFLRYSTLAFLIPRFGNWWPDEFISTLRYEISGDALRVRHGVFFVHDKTIPLNRITDVVLYQGPLLRYFDVWLLFVQTAGSTTREASLMALANPEETRDLLVERIRQSGGKKLP